MSDEERASYAVKLVIAYDGRAFHGWQRQPGQRTVQGVLQDAVRRLDPDATDLRGASRTDSGVHASGQVVSFDTTRALPEKGWRMELNKMLPDDLAIRDVAREAARYDPRFDSLGKLYRYRIHVGESRDPLRDAHSWHVSPSFGRRDVLDREPSVESYLDLEAMRRAASMLEGTHDFRAFRSADDERENTIRTMRRVSILTPYANEPDSLAIEVHGNAFMKNMVRIMAGTLMDIGRGRLGTEAITTLLGRDGRRQDGGQTAPAHGLCLIRVDLGRIALCQRMETA